MLIYIHVPFCRSRCAYCAFHSIPLAVSDNAGAQVDEYAQILLVELARCGDEYGGESISSVFFGGGTPSLLPPRFVGSVLERIDKHFKLAPKAEVTLEANPESLRSKAACADFLSAGVNRLSIGLQSLDGETLRLLGRPHKAQDSLHAVYQAREAGFSNISVDLMWGLPGQSIRQWLQTLKDVARLGPDHISAYGLTLEPGTPLERQNAEGKLILPPERDQSLMFMEGSAHLEAAGYLHYEISNYAKMGFQCRHNLGYWEGEDYLGLGPSSTSTVGDRRWTNPADLKVWRDRILQGPSQKDIEILTPRIRVLELIMLRLRTARGLRLKSYEEMTGHDFLKNNQKLVQSMHENGLIRIRNGYLALTRSGMLVSNAIISNLFERSQQALPDGSFKFDKDALKTEPGDLNPPKIHAAFQAIPVSWTQL